MEQAAWLGREGPVRPIIQAFLLDAVDTQLARADHRGCLAVNAAVEVGSAEPDVASLAELTSTASSRHSVR